jgi:hypothetical protein
MAPAFIALTDIGMSPWPVIKMIGIANIRLSQFGLKVETANPRQPDIEDQTACNIWRLDLLKFVDRTEQFDPQAHRSEKTAESRAHRHIVVDDANDRFLGTRGFMR